MELGKIKANELIFSNTIEDDGINTYTTLNDYDWMSYSIKTRFHTKEYGILLVEFEFFGMVFSQMTVEQTINGEKFQIIYEYDSDIFIKYIKLFLKKHIESWDDLVYAFNGEDIVLEFYNEVIEKKLSVISNKIE